MKKAAKLIAAGDYGGITNQMHKSASEVITAAVYAGWRPDDGKTNVDWQASLNDIEWFVRHCAEYFVAGGEYNAYKHGLRVVTGSMTLGVAARGDTEVRSVVSMKHSLSYLELGETPEGYTAEEVTKQLDVDHSFAIIQSASLVLSLMREYRIARVLGVPDQLKVISINRRLFIGVKQIKKAIFSF